MLAVRRSVIEAPLLKEGNFCMSLMRRKHCRL